MKQNNVMSKTDMQELIEMINVEISQIKSLNPYNHGQRDALTDLRSKATELLAKEKEQIVDAFKEGYYEGIRPDVNYETTEQYFTQTYKQ